MVYCIFLYGFRSKYMDPGGAKAEDALEDQLIRGASERDRKLYIDTDYRYQRSCDRLSSCTTFCQFCSLLYCPFSATCRAHDS